MDDALVDVEYTLRPISPTHNSNQFSQDLPRTTNPTQLTIRSHTKSRTGCLTCKMRRVKCDEAKPICQRCEDGNFICKGYVVPEPNRKSAPVSQRPHTKSKSGCVTCKKRRVKCDEAKPQCRRCSTAGKTCEYSSSQTAAENQIVNRRPLQPRQPSIPHLSLNLNQGSEGEKKSFSFYIAVLGPMLSGTFDTEFWNKILLQMSNAEPSIWHSVISLSMFTQRTIPHYINSASKDYNALQHYNKAIVALQRSTAESPMQTELILVACSLFTCIELLLGGIPGAFSHIANGVKIIEDWKTKSVTASPWQRDVVENHMMPIFDHMSTQSLFGFSHYEFEGIKQETNRLDELYKALLEPSTVEFPINMYETQQQLLAKSTKWLKDFEGILSRSTLVDINNEEIDAIPYIRYDDAVLRIRIQTLLSINELCYDNHLDEFSKAIDYAEEALAGTLKRGPKFSTTLLLTMPKERTALFTIATKCRDRRMRRRALDFMKKTKDELIFKNDDVATKVAERVVEIEEEGMGAFPEDESLTSDWSRIYEVVFDLETKVGPVPVSFKMRSKTNLGEWVWIHEFIEH